MKERSNVGQVWLDPHDDHLLLIVSEDEGCYRLLDLTDGVVHNYIRKHWLTDNMWRRVA